MRKIALEEWLISLGLEKSIVDQTIVQFKGEDIFTVEDVLKLGDNDLKDLGVKLGTRKKIMEGIEKYVKGSPTNSVRSDGGGSVEFNPMTVSPMLDVEIKPQTPSSRSLSSETGSKSAPIVSSVSASGSIDSEPYHSNASTDQKTGKLYRIGVFYNDFADILTPYETKYLRVAKSEDRKTKENFLKVLSSRDDITVEVKPVPDIPAVSKIAASDNMIGVCSGEGSVYMIGPKNLSSICLGKQKTSKRQIKIKAKAVLENGEKFARVSCGSFHAIALTTNGRIFSWGYNINTSIIGTNADENIKLMQQTNPQYEVSGQLGRGKGLANLPGEVRKIKGPVLDLSAGGVHTGVVTTSGVYMFGNNREGQIGSKSKEGKKAVKHAVLVEALQSKKIIKIACGGHHTIALSQMQEVFAWGYNNKGQLGLKEAPQIVPTPTLIEGLKTAEITQISAGNLHSAGLSARGKIYTWGSNDFGQLGRKRTGNEPGEVQDALKDVLVYQMACGSGSTCCVTHNGHVYVWGRFAGNNLTCHELVPRRVTSDCLFVNHVESGLTHYAVLVDEELTEVITYLASSASLDVNGGIADDVLQHLMSIPNAMVKIVQERAQEFLSQKFDGDFPSVQADNTVLTLQVDDRAPVVSQTFNLTNKSNNNIDIKVTTFSVPSGCNITCDIPSHIKGGKSQPIKVTLTAKDLTEETTSLLVLTLDQGKKSRAGKFFVLLKMVPGVSSGKRDIKRAPSTRRNIVPPTTKDTIDVKNAEVVLFEKLGTGGSGASVYRCSVNGFSCAVKILRNPDGDNLKYFKDEISLLETLRHENIVRYLGHDTTSNSIRLFMEFYPYSLNILIQKRKGKYFPAKESKKVGFEIAKGLAYLHNHNPPIIHRDLKPGNVLVALDENDDAKLIKITDFDISRTLTDVNSGPMTVAGTPVFTAPEVYTSKSQNKSYTVLADIWSFGMLMYEVISLKQPYYHIKTNVDITENILKGAQPLLPSDLDQSVGSVVSIIQSCLKLNPSDRPNATQLIQRFATEM